MKNKNIILFHKKYYDYFVFIDVWRSSSSYYNITLRKKILIKSPMLLLIFKIGVIVKCKLLHTYKNIYFIYSDYLF